MTKRLTLLVFMAADNDLENFAVKDLHEMERFGSSADLNVVVQVDQRGDGQSGPALRGLIEKDENWVAFPHRYISSLEDIGETNTGDPAVLTEFIRWGVSNFPAERYILVIWNHGSGWKPEFIGEEIDATVDVELATAVKGGSYSEYFQRRTSRTLFRNTALREVENFLQSYVMWPPPAGSDLTAEDLVARAIGLDESSGNDALDSLELETAIRIGLETADDGTGRNLKFAVIGLDACLMAGIEVSFQLKDLTDYIVASEEIEPSTGWKYDLLIEALINDPDQESSDISKQCVATYIEGLRNFHIRLVTQSSVDTSQIQDLVEKIDDFSGLVLTHLSENFMAVANAEKRATRFFDKDYIDLGDFFGRVGALVSEIDIEAISASYASAIVASQHLFEGDKKPTGVSIFFPSRPELRHDYQTLAFASVADKWSDFLRAYHFL